MTKSYRQITRSVSASLVKLRAGKPDIMKAFNALEKTGAIARSGPEIVIRKRVAI